MVELEASGSRLAALGQLTLTRFREFYREKGAVFWAFGFPILLALGLGLAFRERGVAPARVALLDVGPSLAEQIAQLAADGHVDLVEHDAEHAARALRIGAIDLVIAGTQPIEYRFDRTRMESRIARAEVDALLQASAGRRDALAVRDGPVDAQNRYIDFLFPGILGMTLMSSCIWGIGYTLVLARRRRLLVRLAATPMRRSDFLLSMGLSRFVFLAAEIGLFILFGALVFDIHVRGSWVGLALIAILGATAFSSIALAAIARVESLEAANGVLNLVTLPMWMLSGIFFSYERFPDALHAPIRLLPLTAVNDGLRGVIHEGRALGGLGFEFAVLIVWSVLAFALARARFRWQ